MLLPFLMGQGLHVLLLHSPLLISYQIVHKIRHSIATVATVLPQFNAVVIAASLPGWCTMLLMRSNCSLVDVTATVTNEALLALCLHGAALVTMQRRWPLPPS